MYNPYFIMWSSSSRSCIIYKRNLCYIYYTLYLSLKLSIYLTVLLSIASVQFCLMSRINAAWQTADCTWIHGSVADNCHGEQWKMTNQCLTSIDEQTEKGRRGEAARMMFLRLMIVVVVVVGYVVPVAKLKNTQNSTKMWRFSIAKMVRFTGKPNERGGGSRLQLLEFRADIETFVFGLKQADIFGWLHS